MAHRAEISQCLRVVEGDWAALLEADASRLARHQVLLLRLPPAEAFGLPARPGGPPAALRALGERLRELAGRLEEGTKLLLLGEPEVLPHLDAALGDRLRFHHWIAVRCRPRRRGRPLPEEHLGLTIYARGPGPLDHAPVRIAHAHCAACGRTVKDYGGKRHLYDAYGTLMSDVWRDIAIDAADPLPAAVVERVRDMFSVPGHRSMLVLPADRLPDLGAPAEPTGGPPGPPAPAPADRPRPTPPLGDRLLCGDALALLPALPEASVDLAIADPPYNLAKGYRGYRDRLAAEAYFAWCDRWIEALSRVLRPGGLLVVLNTPRAALRHFPSLQRRLTFLQWIVWDSMSMPVRRIMPSHYPLLLFSRGTPALPVPVGSDPAAPYLRPAPEGLCQRPSCVAARQRRGPDPVGELTDLWSDVHRVKHNALRADHPCQLPPKLIRRLLALLTRPGDLVLDPFNGVGTTTLCAAQLGRRYVGIEIDADYHRLALERHGLLARGGDPFPRRRGAPGAKNSPVARVPRRRYEVPKRTLQLAVRELAQRLGHAPSPAELEALGPYPIRYYREYFRSWSEVTAALRATGIPEAGQGAER